MELVFRVRYRKHVAVGVIASFFGSLAIGGVLTNTITDYTPETDLVYRYFDNFNPCIFFDHYPANIVALLGCSFLSIFWSAAGWFLFVHSAAAYHRNDGEPKDFWNSLSLVFSSGILTIICLSFVNIFAVDLYEHHVPKVNLSATNTSGWTQDELEFGHLTPLVVSKVGDHTLWFTLLLLGDILLFSMAWSYASRLVRRKGSLTSSMGYKATRIAIFAIYLLSVPFYCMSLMSVVFGYDGNDRIPEYDEVHRPTLLRIVLWWKTKTMVALWFSLIIAAAHYVVFANSVAIKFTARLVAIPGKVTPHKGDESSSPPADAIKGIVCPESLLTRAFMIFGTLMFFTYCFVDISDAEDGVHPLISGFRHPPWSFVYAPTWLAIVVLLSLSSAMRCVRVYLSAGTKNRMAWLAFVVLSFITALIPFAGILAIIPKVTFIGGASSVFIILLGLQTLFGWKLSSCASSSRFVVPAFTILCMLLGVLMTLAPVPVAPAIMVLLCMSEKVARVSGMPQIELSAEAEF